MDSVYYAFNPWWEHKPFDSGIPRSGYLAEIEKPFGRKQIDIVLGSRRVGKTFFLKQIIKKCLNNGIPPSHVLYLALDHPKLLKTTISEHLKQFRKIFMHSIQKKLYLFLDEVHDSPRWEEELKALYDLENVKIVCTGSTASLLTEQGGKLTGRQIVTTIYPLSFGEYLSFRDIKPAKAEDYKSEKLLEEYFVHGGYPENVLEPSEEYLNNLLEDIIARDIVKLRRINKPGILKDLLLILAASVGSRTSFNKLSKILGITVDTVKDYIGYLESAFLIKPLGKWSESQADRIYSQKKIYFYDMGMKSLLSSKEDFGAKAENLVFLKLLKQKVSCGYYAESEKELDFACGSFRIPQAIEVKYLSSIDWGDKRFSGAKLFLKRHPSAKELLIISKDTEEKLQDHEVRIRAVPCWKYLLECG